jgi:hypothetical protein
MLRIIAALLLTCAVAAPAAASEEPLVELPLAWAGLVLGMSAEEFDRIACTRPACRQGHGARARVSYVIDAGDARSLEVLAGSPTPFAVRWATFLRGRLVGFHVAPAGALSIEAREALTTHVLRRFGPPAEALTTLAWCGSTGAELSFDPQVGWLALHQVRRHGALEADEAIDSMCLLHN